MISGFSTDTASKTGLSDRTIRPARYARPVAKKKSGHRRAKETLNVRDLGGGTWEVRWYTAGRRGKYRSKRLKNVSRDEAEAYLLAKRAEAKAGVITPGTRIRFADLARRYQETHVPHLAESWQKNVNGYVNDILIPAFGAIPAASITPGDVQAFQTKRLTEKTARNRPPSAETVNHEVRCLKSILAFGVRERLLEVHPLPPRSVKPLPVPTEEERAGLFYTPQDARALFAAFDDPDRWAAYVAKTRRLGPVAFSPVLGIERRFGGGRKPASEASEAERLRYRAAMDVLKAVYLTGSRVGEIVNLTWADVDMSAGLVRIFQPKVKRPKVLPIVPALGALLEAQLARQQGRRRRAEGPPPGAPVFQRPEGGAWEMARLQRTYRLARTLSGVRPALRIHDLRHGAGTALMLAGTPDRLVQAYLGHRSGASTRRYQHAAAGHLLGAAAVMSLAAGGPPDGVVNGSVNVADPPKRPRKRPKPA